MANAVIKHFRRYENLISNDVITLAKTKVEITSAFSGSLRISINRKKMTSARELEMCQKLIDFRVLSIIGTPLEATLLGKMVLIKKISLQLLNGWEIFYAVLNKMMLWTYSVSIQNNKRF